MGHKMSTVKKVQNLGIDPDNVILHVSENNTTFCVWAIDEKLFYARFSDFEWSYMNGDPLVLEGDYSLVLDNDCIHSDQNDDIHILYYENEVLKYVRSEYLEWSEPEVVIADQVSTFSASCQLESPNDTFLCYIHRIPESNDKLIIHGINDDVDYEKTLPIENNNLLMTQIANGKLYLFWVEYDGCKSRIKYFSFDLTSKTFDSSSAYSVEFTETEGEILSLDFNAIP